MDAGSIGRTVRWARKRAGMTQQELAAATGMPQSTVARIEAGTTLPRTNTLLAILERTGHDLRVEPVGSRPEPTRELLRLRPVDRTRRALGRVSRDRRASPTYVLRRLRRFGVPFVLIGPLAEVVHGAARQVERVEVCVAATDVARQRLAMTTEDLGEELPDGLIVTHNRAGDDYDTLARTAEWTMVDTSLRVLVASIEDLILARHVGQTEDDRAAEAELRALARATIPA